MKKVITTGRFTKVYESGGRFTKVYIGEDGGRFTKVTEANGDTVLVPQISTSGNAGEQGRNVSLNVMAAKLGITPKLLRSWTHAKAQKAARALAIPFTPLGNMLLFDTDIIDDWLERRRIAGRSPAGLSPAALIKKLRLAGRRKTKAK